jgi:hypothetical protein
MKPGFVKSKLKNKIHILKYNNSQDIDIIAPTTICSGKTEALRGNKAKK